MRTCESCGFENAEPEKPCPLCGLTGSRRSSLFSEAPTETAPGAGGLMQDQSPALLSPGRGQPPTLAAGIVYAERYRIEALLGRGGMGTVYRVRDLHDQSERALKILHTLADEDPEGAERFKRETAILAKIRHPAVPAIFGSGVSERQLYFVAEYIAGRDLKSEIGARGPWAAPQASGLGATVADALGVAHGLGIVHRDVKPHNIMIATDGSVRLLDFGVARGIGLDMATITKTGMIVGTPEYMSPEQFASHRVDERSDIYSLGVVLFELVTGRLPFRGDTPVGVAMRHLSEAPPAPRSLSHDLPSWLDRIILTCLEKDPAKRFRTAAELAAELRQKRGSGLRRKVRELPNGDAILEDDGETSAWALALATPRERPEWALEMTLRYRESYYRLEEILPPERRTGGGRWIYHFGFWPGQEIFRKFVDYDEAGGSPTEGGSLAAKLKKWLPGGKDS